MAPSGLAMMLKSFGVDIEAEKKKLENYGNEFMTLVKSFDARLARIEMHLGIEVQDGNSNGNTPSLGSGSTGSGKPSGS